MISHFWGFGVKESVELNIALFQTKNLEKMHIPVLNVTSYKTYLENDLMDSFNYFLKERKDTLKSLIIGRVIQYSHEMNILHGLSYCEKVEEIKIQDASFVTNEDLDTLSHLPKLQKLELVKLGYLGLSELSSSEYKRIMEEKKPLDLCLFFKNLNTDCLKFLSISQCEIITEDNIITLSENGCPKLVKLVIEKCQNLRLKEKTLKNLVENCPQIQSVQFHWKMITQISDKFWNVLSKKIIIFISMGESCLSIKDFVNNKKGIIQQ